MEEAAAAAQSMRDQAEMLADAVSVLRLADHQADPKRLAVRAAAGEDRAGRQAVRRLPA